MNNVPQLEASTVARGGAGEIMNAQAQALLNRTAQLALDVATAQSTAASAGSAAATAQGTAASAVTAAGTAQSTANAALPKAGGTLTGPLVLAGDATAPLNPMTARQSAGVVGSVRNLRQYVSVASASATITADEVIVETALGGTRFCLSSFSSAVNLTTTGAGGMDTGAAPVSGFVAIYAIYNPTASTRALLAVNASSAVAPEIYAGANMPSGYTASALVSVWPTNASSLLMIGLMENRKFTYDAPKSEYTTAATSSVDFTLASAPYNAKRVNCTMFIQSSAGGSASLALYPSGAFTGGASVAAYTASTSAISSCAPISLVTAKTLHVNVSGSVSSGNVSMYSYEF